MKVIDQVWKSKVKYEGLRSSMKALDQVRKWYIKYESRRTRMKITDQIWKSYMEVIDQVWKSKIQYVWKSQIKYETIDYPDFVNFTPNFHDLSIQNKYRYESHKSSMKVIDKVWNNRLSQLC